ncbi:MAG: DUF262 domain-containing protein [Gammaproteobacteria bacterium]|nr:DUF262 domain-containing protein [Chloroflexota bacterium]MYF28595.1 DUF262 domain-containing protein [Gammaproteobacteria bacterium]MYJ96933.1 DUF262 domain-containing protein [Pseudomonadota bacterium]
MYQQGGTIKQALDKIVSNEYVLPAIQREFVWSPDQICRLFDSLMQGYPFGEFLFWRIEPERSADYRYYGFVLDYHQRDNPHCPDLGQLPNRQITAVLDGQQRLTAFNIGLRGSMAVKLPYKWWSSEDAFPQQFLALDLLAPDQRDEEGSRFAFDFVEEAQLGRYEDRLWFRVSDIVGMNSGPDMLDWLLARGLEREDQGRAYRVLDRLYQVVHTEPTVAYYEELNQDIEHVLSIFIRRNSGGTTLSYSDLLLSIATSQWKTLDARKEVHRLVDDLNQIGPGLGLTKDFVLKAGLMLTDIASVGFQVRNFTQANMEILEENWQKIRDALVETVQIVTGFGFNANNIRAASALLPIAYYVYRIGAPTNFDTHSSYENDRKSIRGRLTRSILKASGIWGSGLDTLLTALREVIRDAGDLGFPAAEMRRVMVQRGKSLEFSVEEIEDLADMGIGDRRTFGLLALLSPFIDLQRHQFHIDHIFPRSRFTRKRLHDAGIAVENVDTFMDCADRIANLQLLDGTSNIEKQATLPAEWIDARYPTEEAQRHYREKYLLETVPGDMTGFLEFYEARRARLQVRISELVNSV